MAQVNTNTSFGVAAFGEILRLATKNDIAAFPFTKMADDIARGKKLVIAVSPEEGTTMLKDFEIIDVPDGDWRKTDERDRLLLTLGEFKSKVDRLVSDILNAEELLHLPIEIKQALMDRA